MIQKKICMLGAFGVGKSSLVKRYLHSRFDEAYHVTLGVRVEKKSVLVSGRDVSLMIWDFAGEDGVIELPLSYLRGAAGCIIVADGTRPATIDTAITLHERVHQHIGKLPSIIALNKFDQRDEWDLRTEDLRELRRRTGPVMRTSARNGHQADALFENLTQRILIRDAQRGQQAEGAIHGHTA